MGDDMTKIEWTDYTFNPWNGCAKVSAGCKNCYAETLDARGMRSPERHWGATAPRLFASEAHMAKPLAWNRAAAKAGERRRVFCMSMGDLFELHEDPTTAERQRAYRKRVFYLIEQTPWLDWLLLTKRPENVHGLLPWACVDPFPANVRLGVSIENQEVAEYRLPLVLDLAEMYGTRPFLSCEPLLGPIDLGEAAGGRSAAAAWLGWVIAGSESGPRARPAELDWYRSLRDQCQRLGVPFFLKQFAERDRGRVSKVSLPLLDGRQWAEFPVVSYER